ncbi:MAG: glycosyltransferase family 2 protein [Eubacteriales bacterium]
MSELISVIITTHNRVELLKQAIGSVKNQTYRNLECFIIDDASDYDIRPEVEGLMDERFQLIQIPKSESGGSNYARNLGIKRSQGQYIALLDDDDTWEVEKLEKQVNSLQQVGDARISYCLRRFVYHNGACDYEQYHTGQEGDCSRKIFYSIIGTTSSLMIEANLLKEELFDKKLQFWQEYDVMIRLCQKTKVVCVKEHLVNYLVNMHDKERKTNQYEEWLLSVKFIDEKYHTFIQQLTEEEKQKKELLFYGDACNRLYLSGRKKERRKYFKAMYRISRNKKHLVKYLFNIDRIDIWHMKSRLLGK